MWKPLDIEGLRLYQVELRFRLHPDWNKTNIVAAKSPRHAKQLIEDVYKNIIWIENPDFRSLVLNIYMPESWWENGVVENEESEDE